ncbi:MAG: SelT/SelW/SelH family protein [bacterium]|nr:SelT/SelW/SelH family protein [bacterium]
MAADLEKEFGAKIEYIKSGGGVFEVELNGKLIFSKKAAGRFPTSKEIVNKIQAMS